MNDRYLRAQGMDPEEVRAKRDSKLNELQARVDAALQEAKAEKARREQGLIPAEAPETDVPAAPAPPAAPKEPEAFELRGGQVSIQPVDAPIPLDLAGLPPELQAALQRMQPKTAAADGKRYRNRVAVFVLDDKDRVLVSMKDENRPDLPAGGTDQQNLNAAAEREVLEETGWQIEDIASVPGTSAELFLWPEDFKEKQRAKGRTHDGFRNYYRWARATKRDRSLYDETEDAKTHLRFVPISELIEKYERAAKRKGNEWAQMDRANAAALRALQEKLDSEGAAMSNEKTAVTLDQMRGAVDAMKGSGKLIRRNLRRSSDAADGMGRLTRPRGMNYETHGLGPSAVTRSIAEEGMVSRGATPEHARNTLDGILGEGAPSRVFMAGDMGDFLRGRKDHVAGKVREYNELTPEQRRNVPRSTTRQLAREWDSLLTSEENLPFFDAADREALNRSIMLHENAEIGKHFGDVPFASHASTRPMLQDLNIAATIEGPGSNAGGELWNMRYDELQDLEKIVPGLERLRLGENRISRHAQKRIQEIYERNAAKKQASTHVEGGTEYTVHEVLTSKFAQEFPALAIDHVNDMLYKEAISGRQAVDMVKDFFRAGEATRRAPVGDVLDAATEATRNQARRADNLANIIPHNAAPPEMTPEMQARLRARMAGGSAAPAPAAPLPQVTPAQQAARADNLANIIPHNAAPPEMTPEMQARLRRSLGRGADDVADARAERLMQNNRMDLQASPDPGTMPASKTTPAAAASAPTSAQTPAAPATPAAAAPAPAPAAVDPGPQRAYPLGMQPQDSVFDPLGTYAPATRQFGLPAHLQAPRPTRTPEAPAPAKPLRAGPQEGPNTPPTNAPAAKNTIEPADPTPTTPDVQPGKAMDPTDTTPATAMVPAGAPPTPPPTGSAQYPAAADPGPGFVRRNAAPLLAGGVGLGGGALGMQQYQENRRPDDFLGRTMYDLGIGR